MDKVTPLNPSSFYHIYNRGNGGINIFKEEKNYNYFLLLLGRHIEPVAEIYAYCLLKNHFHILVKIKERGLIINQIEKKQSRQDIPRFLSQQFSNCFNAYAKAFNKMYNYTGSLFQERFKRILIDNKAYLANCITYIHLNPEHHGFVEKYDDWNHSSFNSHLSYKQTKLMRSSVIELFGTKDKFKEEHYAPKTIKPEVAEIFLNEGLVNTN